MEVLLDLYANLDFNQALIYCKIKKSVGNKKDHNDHDFTVSAIQGEIDQINRDNIMKEFRILFIYI
jgi:superfamily II DNA/RNA helicase